MNQDNKSKFLSNNATFQKVIVDTFTLIERGLLHRLDKKMFVQTQRKN